MKKLLPSILLLVAGIQCTNSEISHSKGSFGYDVDLLKKNQKDVIVLGRKDGPQILISTAYQGRVMSSSIEGKNGRSLGWINHELIASGKIEPHMHAVGGEERLWLGPEGGQFSIYFKKGEAFTFNNWYVPSAFDTESFQLVQKNENMAAFKKDFELINYSGTPFSVSVDRKIKLLNKDELKKILNIELPKGCRFVGFESENTLINKGKDEWNEQSGMLSIWVLSMLKASDHSTICVPYKKGLESELGKIVTDDYFGLIPNERLKVHSNAILLKADGHYRSKIGISPRRALPFAGSYDSDNNILTIANFSLHDNEFRYVNSLWKIQDQPFSGDAVNAYNDGPVNGKQMGAFYEIESSSPAANLEPGKSIHHVHRTFHFSGPKKQLDQISTLLLGLHLDEISL